MKSDIVDSTSELLEVTAMAEEWLKNKIRSESAVVYIHCGNLEFFEESILSDLAQIICSSDIDEMEIIDDVELAKSKCKSRVLVDIVSPAAIKEDEDDVKQFIELCTSDPDTDHYVVVLKDMAGGEESKIKHLYENKMRVIEKRFVSDNLYDWVVNGEE